MPRSRPESGSTTAPRAAGVPGTSVVIFLLLLAAGLGGFAVWFQRHQTRRCLDFLGPLAARRIQSAGRVELWTLAADGSVIRSVGRRDVSRAAGLIHLRRGLVEDVNYRWAAGRGPSQPLPAGAWDAALAFADSDGRTVLAFDLDGDGSMTVVGRPGRITLGPIGPGLRTWIGTTKGDF